MEGHYKKSDSEIILQDNTHLNRTKFKSKAVFQNIQSSNFFRMSQLPPNMAWIFKKTFDPFVSTQGLLSF